MIVDVFYILFESVFILYTWLHYSWGNFKLNLRIRWWELSYYHHHHPLNDQLCWISLKWFSIIQWYSYRRLKTLPLNSGLWEFMGSGSMKGVGKVVMHPLLRRVATSEGLWTRAVNKPSGPFFIMIPWVAAHAVRWSGIPKVARSRFAQCSKSCDLQPSPHCSVQYVELRGYCPV